MVLSSPPTCQRQQLPPSVLIEKIHVNKAVNSPAGKNVYVSFQPHTCTQKRALPTSLLLGPGQHLADIRGLPSPHRHPEHVQGHPVMYTRTRLKSEQSSRCAEAGPTCLFSFIGDTFVPFLGMPFLPLIQMQDCSQFRTASRPLPEHPEQVTDAGP